MAEVLGFSEPAGWQTLHLFNWFNLFNWFGLSQPIQPIRPKNQLDKSLNPET
jgi:hypothetical protein